MKVWVFEDNLIWSSRLVKSLRSLGHEPLVTTAVPEGTAEAAVVNLGSPKLGELVPQLRERGVYTIGHAGHKEKDLLQLGREAGCDAIATNSELTFKIESLLQKVP